MILRFLGALLLVAAGTLAGWSRAAALKKQKRFLNEMDSALALTQREIEGLLRPLPDVFALLAEQGGSSVRGFFACLSLTVGERPLDELWAKALDTLELPEGTRLTLLPLGSVLGRCGASGQGAEISLAREKLRGLEEGVSRELATRGRTYTGLGAAAGAMLAILLL